MATHTTNFNLSKPENTDSQSSFISDYSGNMDIIDANLGRGGHVIVDPNGTSMTQEDKLQFVGSVSVSDDALDGKTIVNISGGGGGGATMLLNTIYSDTEKKIGYWRDNKPLYQKAVDIGSLPSNDTKTVAHGVSDIDLIVSCEGFVYNSSYTFLSLPSINVDSLTYGVQLECDRTNISVKTKETWMNIYSGFVVIQYTKTTDTPEPNPEFGNAIYLPTIYSEEEKEVGVWIDNKPLYQKTLTGNSNPNSTSIRVSVSALDLETICNAYLVTNSSTANTQDYYYDNADHLRWYYDDKVNEYLTIEYGSSYPSRPFEWRLTLQYTKTTDTAGSGNWNTDGVPTHHYSTNEQVVGTYFGKPLYEKTWDNLSISLSGDSWVYFNDPVDIDNVVSFDAHYNNSGRYLHCAISEYQRSDSYGIMFSGFNGFNRTVNRITAQYTKSTD